MATISLAICPASARDITNLTPQVGLNYINWTWDDVRDSYIDAIYIDGFYAQGNTTEWGIDPKNGFHMGSFILTGLNPNETHQITVWDDYPFTNANGLQSDATTLSGEQVQNTEGESLLAWSNQWIWVIAIMVLMIAGTLRRLGVFAVLASIVSLVALGNFVINNPSISASLNDIYFYIYAFFFVFPWIYLHFKGGITR